MTTSRFKKGVKYPYWIYRRIDLNIAPPTFRWPIESFPDQYYQIDKIYFQYLAPGDPPVFQEIFVEVIQFAPNRRNQQNAIPITVISSPGKGTTTEFFGSQLFNAKKLPWLILPEEVWELKFSNYTPLLAANYIDVLIAGSFIKEKRLS